MRDTSIPPISPRALLGCLATILAGLVADVAVGPVVLRQWVTLDFVAVAVALAGMRYGPWVGLGLGWLGGAMLAAFTGEPTAIAAFSLGTMGFVAGQARSLAALGLPPLDVLLLLGLLILNHALANVAAMVLLRATPDTAVGGIVLTVVLAGAWLWHRPVASGMVSAKRARV